MPLPVAAYAGASLAISAASSAASWLGARSADKKAKEQAQHDAELQRAATEATIESIVASKEESEKATAVAMSDTSRQAAIARGRILAAAGESGVAGASISDQLLTNYAGEAESRGRQLYNLRSTKAQLSRNITQAKLGAAVAQPKVQKLAPSGGAAALSAAAQMLSIGFNTGLIDK